MVYFNWYKYILPLRSKMLNTEGTKVVKNINIPLNFFAYKYTKKCAKLSKSA
jgi:hypothetical protein